MTEIIVGVTLKADGSGFVGEVRMSEKALKQMGAAARDSARQAGDLTPHFRR